ncbi:hypothetical protein FRC12_024464 [Ceratobasidium sp. 428]|nr:hypothetical protein FRC12_024464 [Ceratobasidium sp. 428]
MRNFNRPAPTPSGSPSVSIRHLNTHPPETLTEIILPYQYRSSPAIAPSPLRHCAAFDEGGIPIAPVSARVGPVYEPSEAVPLPGMQTAHSFQAAPAHCRTSCAESARPEVRPSILQACL